jgi:ubiquinone/menaquinone biosynthesis C-methylase UbiE
MTAETSPEKHFDALAGMWAALYEGPETSLNVSFRVRLTRALELLPAHGRRVLDLGCGPGPLAAALVERSGAYVGVDFVQGMLLQAQRRHPRALLVRATQRLPFQEASFDAVVALGFLEYLRDPGAAFREMKRVVRPGGVVVVSVPKRLHVDVIAVKLTAPLRAIASLFVGRRSDAVERLRLSPSEMDRVASEAGLKAEGGSHYHFTPLPYPLTVFTPGLALRFGRALEWHPARTSFTFFAHGYIGRYRRE